MVDDVIGRETPRLVVQFVGVPRIQARRRKASKQIVQKTWGAQVSKVPSNSFKSGVRISPSGLDHKVTI